MEKEINDYELDQKIKKLEFYKNEFKVEIFELENESDKKTIESYEKILEEEYKELGVLKSKMYQLENSICNYESSLKFRRECLEKRYKTIDELKRYEETIRLENENFKNQEKKKMLKLNKIINKNRLLSYLPGIEYDFIITYDFQNSEKEIERKVFDYWYNTKKGRPIKTIKFPGEKKKYQVIVHRSAYLKYILDHEDKYKKVKKEKIKN